MPGQKTAAEIAALTGGTCIGDETVSVTGAASLSEATGTDASFLGNPKYTDHVLPSRAAIVMVPADFDIAPPEGRAWIASGNPSMAFAQVVAVFAPAPLTHEPGLHAAAAVDPSASVPASVHVGACAVIERDAVIGENSVIGPGCFVGAETRIGADCLLHANVTIRERCVVGDRVAIHPGTVVGSDGFGYIPGPTGHTKIPQVGIVQIDDDVEIGALVAIDRARFGKTWIQQGAKIDNLVQIAHNVVVGAHCFLIAQCGISGSTRIGVGSVLAGQAGVAGHLTLGDRVQVAAKGGVSKDIPSGHTVIGQPAVDQRKFLRQQMALKRMERFQRTVKELQAEVAALKEQLGQGGA